LSARCGRIDRNLVDESGYLEPVARSRGRWDSSLCRPIQRRTSDHFLAKGTGACPVFPGKRYEEWTLDDAAGLDVAAVRPIRDEIERRVLALLDPLGVPVHT
jgi:hypothetical protein